ncbi:MAG: hypothetical protein [Bacteriophage sp.]|nr:MAG: hypothetical protein [Bacteriophage sp.]
MMKLVAVAVVAFLVGCLAEGALRDNRTVEKLQAKVSQLHEFNCKLAAEKQVKADYCGDVK